MSAPTGPGARNSRARFLQVSLGAVALAAAFTLAPAGAPGLGPCTVSWDDGGGDDSWQTAANWDTNAVPGAADRVCLVDDGTVNLTGASATVSELTVDGATTLTFRNDLMVLDEALNDGTIVMDGVTSNPRFAISDGNDATTELLTNSGTLRTESTRADTHFYVHGDIQNSGSFTVNDGALHLNNTFAENRPATVTHTGTFTIAADAGGDGSRQMIFNAGDSVTNGGFGFGGEPRVQGASTFTGSARFTVGSGGTLVFDNAASASGNLFAGGGSTTLSGTIPAGVTLTSFNDLIAPTGAGNAGTLVLDGVTSNPRLGIADGNDATTELFTNTGTLRTQSTRNDTHFFIHGDIQNDGGFTVEGGRLHLNNSFSENRAATVTHTGTFTIANTASGDGGRRFVSNAGDSVMNGNFDFGGELRVQGASTFTGSARFTVGSGGTLAFENAASASGNLFAGGGSTTLSGTIPAALTLTSFNDLMAPAGAGNAGTLVLDGVTSNPRLGIADGNDATTELFTNTGTLRTQSTRADSHFYIHGDIQNDGAFTVKGGRVHLNRGFEENRLATVTHTGTLTVVTAPPGEINGIVEAGRRIVANAGDFVTDGGGFDHFGELRVQGASTFTGSARFTVGSSGTLAFENAASTTGALFAGGGSTTLNGTIPAGVTLTSFNDLIAPTGGGNAGTLVLDGVTSNPRLGIADGNDATTELFTNTGTIETKSTRADTHFYVNGDIQSSGSISAAGGLLHLNHGFEENRVQTFQSSGNFTVSGTAGVNANRSLVLAGGTLETAANVGFTAFGGLTQTGGAIKLGAGGSLATSNTNKLDLQGGTFETSGTATVGPLNNAAKLILGGNPGILTVQGDYTQLAAGELSMKIAGTAEGTEFDQLKATGLLTLGGKLIVNAEGTFTPAQDQKFTMLLGAGGPRTGKFATVESERVGVFEYQAEYDAQNAILRAQDMVPPETTINSGPEHGAYTLERRPTFTFSSNEPGSTFQCSIDGGDFLACSGPGDAHTTQELADGEHTFAVWAIDPGRNPDRTFAYRRFHVGNLPSTAVGQPPAPPPTYPDLTFDETDPKLTVGKVRRKGLRAFRVKVSCNEQCTVSADAIGVLKGVRAKRGHKRKKRVEMALAEKYMTLKPGQKATLTLKLPRRIRRQLQEAIGRARSEVAVIQVEAFDAAGNGSRKTRKKKL